MSSTLLRSVTKAMERIAPLRLAEKWDNVGLLLESPVQAPGKKVLLTIDLTTSVMSESISQNASVIVAYHPTIFKGLQSITMSNPLQASLLRCAASGVSVYSPHTALDSVWGGINDWLAQGLISQNTEAEVTALEGEKIHPSTELSEGASGRLVTLKQPVAMDVLLNRIKTHLNLTHLQVGYPQPGDKAALVRTIAICAGSGGSMLLGKPADVYFTGEMSHHEVLASIAAGKHVVLCGHTNTERGFLPVLAEKLQKELQSDGLDDVKIVISNADRHPLDLV